MALLRPMGSENLQGILVLRTEVMPMFPGQLRSQQPQSLGLKPYLRYTALSPFLPPGSPGLPEGLAPTVLLIFTIAGKQRAHTAWAAFPPRKGTQGHSTTTHSSSPPRDPVSPFHSQAGKGTKFLHPRWQPGSFKHREEEITKTSLSYL